MRYGRMSASETHRTVTRDPGSDDPSDAAVETAARARDRPGDPRQLAGRHSSGAWLAVSGASPAGTARLAGGGVEDLGGEPPCPVLPADSKRQKAASGGAVEMEDAGACCGPDHKTDQGVKHVAHFRWAQNARWSWTRSD